MAGQVASSSGVGASAGGRATPEGGAGPGPGLPGGLARTARDDAAYIRGVSEAARGAPLLGGRFLVFWGLLVGAAWTGQWAVLSGAFGLPAWSLGVLWGAFGVIAGVGMTLLVRGVARKPGRGAVGNRVEASVWTGAGLGLFSYAGAVIVAGLLGALPSVVAYDSILGVAFVVYAVAFLATAAASGQAWLRGFAALSFTGAGIVPFFLGQPVLYLVSAVIVLAVAVVPGVILLRREPADLPAADALTAGAA